MHPVSLGNLINRRTILSIVYNSGSRAGKEREFFVFGVFDSPFCPEQHNMAYLVGYDFGAQGVRTYKAPTVRGRSEVDLLQVVGMREVSLMRERDVLTQAYAPMRNPDYQYDNPHIGDPFWTLAGGQEKEWPATFMDETFIHVPPKDRVFVGTYPEGIVYADRLWNEHGEWVKLAFLSYNTLELEFRNRCSREVQGFIKRNARVLQDKRGEEYQIDTSGHTVILGEDRR